MTSPNSFIRKRTRRDFISLAGKGLGLAALTSAAVASLLRTVEAATKSVAHLSPKDAAMDEGYGPSSKTRLASPAGSSI